MALAPDEDTPSPTNLSTGLHLGPLDDTRFAPGHIFASRYRIVSLLGRGAMGEVYRADDLRLGQTVALKLMSEATAGRHDRLQRFTDEVRLARTIVHPHVCRVYDIGHAEGWYYLSMEYVDGETLASLMRRIGQLPMSKALEMARQLCAGVGAAHDRGVLHRDLKPSNIMVDGRGQMRIMDFGLAVAAHANVREVAGTPGYMAPEQVAGGPVTTKVDLYALGRVLTEILPPGVDPEVTTAIRACLDPNPARRPHSAYEILNAIALPAALTTSTPTPAMVAATPVTDALRPSIARLLLCLAIVGLAAVAWRAHVFNVSPAQVPRPPEVLADRARAILKETRTGTESAVDRAYWFWADPSDDRIRFTYRESSSALVPVNLFRVVSASDPPVDSEGHVMATLEADGSPSTNTPPSRNPFSTGRPRLGEAILWVGSLIGFAIGSVLARRNLRAGEGDRKGAQRLAVFVCCGSMLAGVLRAHHVASVVDELSWLLGVAGWSLLWGGFSWLAYLSFEPYVRRLWPWTLISWTRMLTGRLQDPLVGRDVLVGTLAGITTAGIVLVQIGISGQHPVPVFRQSAVDALTSTVWFGAAMTVGVVDGIQFTVAGIVTFVLFRLLLRRTWIAAVALSVLSIPFSPTGISTLTDAIGTGVIVAFHLAIVVRFGLLATAVTFIVTRLLTWLPLTLNAEAWYFGQSLFVLLTVFGLATYGFFAALGGRPAFGEIKAALK